MKKLIIILISIFFTTSVQALVFEKCYVAESKKITEFDSFQEDKFEKYEYKIYSEGKISHNVIFTDKNLAKLIKDREQFYKEQKEKHGINLGPVKIEKINTKIFNITYLDEKFIKAERVSKVGDHSIITVKIILDLSNGSIKRDALTEYQGRLIDRYTSLINCNISKSSSKSNLLDYWWAVILIIAITFFIFTQSGKRLKKIRRK